VLLLLAIPVHRLCVRVCVCVCVCVCVDRCVQMDLEAQGKAAISTCVAVYFSVLQCVPVCCSVVQYVAA